MRSGRYSKIKTPRVRELAEAFETDPDPLNLLPELAQSRALFVDYLERFEAFQVALNDWHESYRNGSDDPGKKPRQMLDPADAMRLLSEVTKIAKRIEDVRAQNAISRADFYRILTELGRVVDMSVAEHVIDQVVREELLETIHERWLEVRLA